MRAYDHLARVALTWGSPGEPDCDTDLYVCRVAATWTEDGENVFLKPGSIVLGAEPVRRAHPHWFEPLVIEVALAHGLKLSAARVAVTGSNAVERSNYGRGSLHVSTLPTKAPFSVEDPKLAADSRPGLTGRVAPV
jgi:hypothetical protein